MHSGKLNTLLWKPLFLSWIILCIALFIRFSGTESRIQRSWLDEWQYFPAKLSRIAPITYFMDLAAALLGILVFSAVAIALGIFILKTLKIPLEAHKQKLIEWLAVIATAFLVGQGLLSIILLTLASLYKITPLYTAIVFLVLFLISFRSTVEFFKDNPFPKFSKTENKKNLTEKLVFWLAVSLLLVSLLYSSARLSYDSVTMYFSDAKITALNQHILFFPYNAYEVSSFHPGINYAAIIQLFGDQASRLYSWMSGLSLIILSLALGEKAGLSSRGKKILFLLLITSTAILDLMGDGKIDFPSTAPMVAAIYWLIINIQNKFRSHFLLIGFLAGFSMISRPFNVILGGLFFGIFFLIQAYRQRAGQIINFKVILEALIWICPTAIALALFHIAASWSILGDPLATIHNMTKVTSEVWHYSYDPKNINTIRLLYPLVVTYLNSAQSLGNISPLFLAFLPGILFKNVREKLRMPEFSIDMLIAALGTLVVWIWFSWTIVEIRYIFFLWIILFIPLAHIADITLQSIGQRYQNVVLLILIFFLAFMNLRTIYIALDTYSPIDANDTAHCYDINFCRFLEKINAVAAPGDRVLTLNAYRYYMRPDLFACSTKSQEYFSLRMASQQDSQTFWREIYRQGYKYVIYEFNYSEFLLYMKIMPSPQNVPGWLTLETLYSDPDSLIYVYKLTATNPPIEIEKTCRKNDENIWEVQPFSKSK
jgi:hypothetical protein